MQTESLKCSGCGAGIERPATGDVVKCPYCQTEQVLPERAARPMRPEDIGAAMNHARETMDKLMGSAFPGMRIFKALIPIIVLVVFAIAALVIARVLFAMR
jgi:DNA-directed RNA polymerase subunit RPC12/RpoP